MPSTLGRAGFTGNTVPPNGLLSRFRSTFRPALAGRSAAPITATLRGENTASSGCRSERSTSCAGSLVGLPLGLLAGYIAVAPDDRRSAAAHLRCARVAHSVAPPPR